MNLRGTAPNDKPEVKHVLILPGTQAFHVGVVAVTQTDFTHNIDAATNRLNGVKRLMREESISGQPIIDNPVFRDRLM
ncbi:hypothetical protein N9Z25_08505, partial [Luminiphilus sp.]|nr:hypothetical protein [Luminiphilus sp.]